MTPEQPSKFKRRQQLLTQFYRGLAEAKWEGCVLGGREVCWEGAQGQNEDEVVGGRKSIILCMVLCTCLNYYFVSNTILFPCISWSTIKHDRKGKQEPGRWINIELLFLSALTDMFLERTQTNFAKAREKIGENELVKCSTIRKNGRGIVAYQKKRQAKFPYDPFETDSCAHLDSEQVTSCRLLI